MATDFTYSGMGFAVMNSATMPVQEIAYTPNLLTEPFRSGGDLSASMVRRAGALPAFRFKAPLASVYTTLATFDPVALTAIEMYAAVFSGVKRAATGATRWKVSSLGTTNKAYAYISSISGEGTGIPLVMAEVTVLICANDGLTEPVVAESASLPVLGSTPALHVISGMSDDGTARWGVANWRIDVGLEMEPIRSDGLFYPTDYRLGAINAVASVTHKDVVSIHTALTSDGKDAASGFILWARAYNPTTKSLAPTGYSFTFAKAFASLESLNFSGTDMPSAVLRLAAYADPGTLTHPVTVATSATLPT